MHFSQGIAITKLRPSSTGLHGVFHKSRVFDPTCLYEAKAKSMIQQKCLCGSFIVKYAEIKILRRKILRLYRRVEVDNPQYGHGYGSC